MKDIKLLFLDIDNTLTSLKSVLALGGYPWPNHIHVHGPYGQETQVYLDRTKPVRNPEYFDKVSVNLVNNLCNLTHTKIVLSSTWRLSTPAKDIVRMLAAIGFDEHLVIGRTDQKGSFRGHQIKRFIDDISTAHNKLVEKELLLPEYADEVGYKVVSYVILDDSGDMLDSQRPNFIHVDGREGLSLENVVAAAKVLLNDNEFNSHKLAKKHAMTESGIILPTADDASSSHGQSS